ncbi:alpha/beta hydrolase [Amycolatopsis cynarae]|uniref:Alpha/beta hydrolase n=1 Tax=Amycolatopsis cynarae TaxID=2995223 RepID=A0ABY7BB20_9PSEU|nr:alpha/beta hydrolase [Amycolatopsis sp. HUAS 11-8]WAL68883.1 alpha/beta hydrolase [Amycolatopsis sp. HUAS 11-8]
MPAVTSADGTTIAYERRGRGPALVLVDGALCCRGAGPLGPLAALLSERFTVHTYDRRGRGESADTPPYAVAREIEDLTAVIGEAGGNAYVYGISSGAALALAAAANGSGIIGLALYEPPFVAEVEDVPGAADYRRRLRELLAAGHGGDAVALFMAQVGVPAPLIEGMRAQPGWAALEAIARTLAYDDEILGDGHLPRDLAAAVAVPTLVLAGGASPARLRGAAKAVAEAIPAARHRVLEGQTHDVAAEALAPVLAEFFS